MLRTATIIATDGHAPPPLDGTPPSAAVAPAQQGAAARAPRATASLPTHPTIPDHLLLPSVRAARKAASVLAPSNEATLAAVTADARLCELVCDSSLAAAVARVQASPRTLEAEIARDPRLGELYTRLAAMAGGRLEAAAREAGEKEKGQLKAT